jgi:hypothetical protein
MTGREIPGVSGAGDLQNIRKAVRNTVLDSLEA